MRTVPLFAAAFISGAAALALALPASAAPAGPPCKPLGAGATICQTAGHIQMVATPTIKAPKAPEFNGWVGMVHHP